MNRDIKKVIRKYFIMGSQNCTRDPEKVLEEAIFGGITGFQYREKGKGSLTDNDKVALGIRLREICRQHTIPFIINDDHHLMEILDADGIHVGQDDEQVKVLRDAYPNKIIGLSVSTKNELENSPIHLVDYIGAGPIFATNTKEDVKEVVGLEWIRYIRKLYPSLPIVGIGGITTENAASVCEAGADGVSVISEITKSMNIEVTVNGL